MLAPLQCEFLALEGLSRLLDTVARVRAAHNPGLKVSGIVLTMFDGRNRLAREVVADARGALGRTVYDTVIPRNVRVSEAPSHGKPALLHAFRSAGAQAYVRLAGEMLRRDAAGRGGGGVSVARSRGGPSPLHAFRGAGVQAYVRPAGETPRRDAAGAEAVA